MYPLPCILQSNLCTNSRVTSGINTIRSEWQTTSDCCFQCLSVPFSNANLAGLLAYWLASLGHNVQGFANTHKSPTCYLMETCPTCCLCLWRKKTLHDEGSSSMPSLQGTWRPSELRTHPKTSTVQNYCMIDSMWMWKKMTVWKNHLSLSSSVFKLLASKQSTAELRKVLWETGICNPMLDRNVHHSSSKSCSLYVP